MKKEIERLRQALAAARRPEAVRRAEERLAEAITAQEAAVESARIRAGIDSSLAEKAKMEDASRSLVDFEGWIDSL